MINNSTRIALGGDHAGFHFKEAIKKYLTENGFQVTDHGTNSESSVDYPDYVHPLAEQIEKGDADLGVLVCGSGNGVCMTVNKHQGIRAALVWNNELASLARRHNNANVICFGERFLKMESVLEMLDIFLQTSFEGGRHENRVNKISIH